MKDVRIVIGANFGDEGKGLMTDYFCSQTDKPVLNVRFNGTCQAGHTVVKDGKRHVFAHFGSGSFNSNVVTYLSSYFYVNPILFNEEYDKLIKMGVKPVVKVSKQSPIILYYDVIYNRVIEQTRGNARHGSCGMGLWEALLRGRANNKIIVDDLQKGVKKLRDKITEIRDNYFVEKLKNDGISLNRNFVIDGEFSDCSSWYDENVVDLYIDECKRMLSRVQLVDEWSVFEDYDYIVFEGAQGLQLDWMNRQYMPYLTASRTGLHNVADMLKYISNPNIEVCYVSRSYLTKHGAGPMPYEVFSKDDLGVLQEDKTNQKNPWQGSFRYGYLDLDVLQKSITNDLFELYSYSYQKSICITHLNETENMIKQYYKNVSLDEFKGMFDGFRFYFSYSEDGKNMIV